MNRSKALVVYSGGQDSTTCLFWAKKHFAQVEAIAFNYGQRHVVELTAASNIAKAAGVPLHIFELDLLSSVSHNALTDKDINVESDQPDHRPPNTLVEGRNMLFLTYAAIFAKSNNIHDLITGVGQSDYSGYPDCRNDFILSLNQTLNLSMAYEYRIHTPLMWLNKSEIWRMADELDVFDLVRNQTITCYHGIPGDGCGTCPSCKLRNRGLVKYLNSEANGQIE
ncbi:MAG: 7-cyano-7-deazaguanine synthase QueC [Bacteroidia bacterium]|nr:7-cyano-7-deazaguanine synthase QueC [Bacteroidia bacterium]